MSADAEQILESVRQSGLVSEAELASASLSIQQDTTRSSRELLAGLVERRALTEFQAEQILAGRGDECVLAGRFRIVELLGAGAMGTVYKATDTKLGRNVAVKVLPAKSVTDSGAVARFRREAMALAKLTHANIVQAFDSGEDRGKHFLVMECVEGTSIAEILRERGRVPPTRAADWAYQAALGLAHAHGRGLIHRDLKPSNLFVTTAGQLKILDLGLARFLSDQVGDSTLTREGVGLGTPDYMPPEQYLNARHADGRSDIYALGCTLYHTIAGQVPFPGSSMTEKYAAHESKEPQPLEEACPEVPAGLAIAVRRMMAKRPADRFQSAREVADALAPYVAGSSSAIVDIRSTAHWEGSQLEMSGFSSRARRRRRLAIGSVIGVAALAAVTVGIWGPLSARPETKLASSGANDASDTPNANPPAVEPPREPEPIDPNVLTVAQDGSAQYRTIGEALAKATPGMTIRVLDDATYAEDVALSSPTTHAGVTLESPRRATIEGTGLASIFIQDVPRVRISGFRIRPMGPAAVAILGKVHGVVLDGLELDGRGSQVLTTEAAALAASSQFGVAAENVDISNEQAPLVIQNCTIRRFSAGVRVSGIGNDYQSPQAARRIVVRNNTFDDCPGGIVLVGQVQQAQVVGNRIARATMTALQLEALVEGAGDVLIANNTVFDSKCAFRLWDETVRGKNIQVANNLVVGRAEEPDMVFVDSGGNQQIQRGPGDGRLVHAAWRWNNNWREVQEPVGEDLASKSWIPPGATDVVRPQIAGLSRDPTAPDFLRPTADSEMAGGGGGKEDPTLPDYVGAAPPEGIEPWDWQQTWDGRHPQMVLTVSEKPEDGGAFRSIGEALDKVARANMTIRVLDEATYEGAIQISNRTLHEGLTLDSPRHATLIANADIPIVTLVNVPRVTLRGIRVEARRKNQFCIVVAGFSSGLLVDEIEMIGDPSVPAPGISIEQAPLAPSDAPMVVRNCTLSYLSFGAQVLGRNVESAARCSNVMLVGNSIHDCGAGIQFGGQVTDLMVAGNRIWDCSSAALGVFDLRSGSGRILIANNTLRSVQNGIVMSDPIADVTDMEIANNLIISERAPDIAFYGSDRTAIAGWRIHHNVRQVPTPAATDPAFAEWVAPTSDTVVPKFPLMSEDPSSKDFLRPSQPSPAGDVAVDRDLPDYLGALPPEGDDPWNWEQTWERRHEREGEVE